MSDYESAFADGKVRIECAQIILQRSQDNSVAVRGPGEIWQDESGKPHFKIFADPVGYQTLLQARFGRGTPSSPGGVAPVVQEKMVFTLWAEDLYGGIWQSLNITPGVYGGPKAGMVTGVLREIVTETELPDLNGEAGVSLRLRGEVRFPRNKTIKKSTEVGGQSQGESNQLAAAIYQDGEFRFQMMPESNHTVLTVNLPETALTPFTVSRLREAIQFALGEQVTPMVEEIYVTGKRIVRLVAPVQGGGRVLPPLGFGLADLQDEVWKLFACYFRHIHQNASDRWHPISDHIGSVIESAVASLHQIQYLRRIPCQSHCFGQKGDLIVREPFYRGNDASSLCI